jgi:hypothetical protein
MKSWPNVPASRGSEVPCSSARPRFSTDMLVGDTSDQSSALAPPDGMELTRVDSSRDISELRQALAFG